MGRFRTVWLTMVLAALGAGLSAGWLTGPARWAHERETAAMTARADGHVERAWLWIDFDPERLPSSASRWHGAARARRCVRIGLVADGAPAAVDLCSLWFPFRDSWTPLGEPTLAPGVPFRWDRGEDGLPRVEVRLPAAGRRWLESQPWAEAGGVGGPALTGLARQLDHPVELIVGAWSETPADRVVAMALAPGRAARALPVAALPRGSGAGNGFVVLVFGAVLWAALIRRETEGWSRGLRWTVTVLPLVALPWWGERLPAVLRWMYPPATQLFATFTENVGPVDGALTRVPPGAAGARDAASLAWSLRTSGYAETLGRFALRPPEGAGGASPDAALADLAGQIVEQTRAWPDAALTGLFDRLAADDGAGQNRVSVAFVPAAREAYLDPRRGAAVRHAALGFLGEFLTAPYADPRPGEPAFEGKLAIWAGLLDVPVDHVRNRASWVFGRVGRPVPTPRPG